MADANLKRHAGPLGAIRQKRTDPIEFVFGLVVELARRAVGVDAVDAAGNHGLDFLGQGFVVDAVVVTNRQQQRGPIAANFAGGQRFHRGTSESGLLVPRAAT